MKQKAMMRMVRIKGACRIDMARGVDFAVAILTHRVNAVVASAFGADGMIGAALNSWAAAKIMEGARRAAQENCNCSQFEK